MSTSHTPWLLFVMATVTVGSACSRSFDQVSPRPSSRGDITRIDLDQGSYVSAHHAIETLRPGWLWRSGNTTLANPDPFPIVYLDGFRRGEIEELHLIPAEDVDTITFLSPADATTRWGTGHLAGAILVRTIRGQPSVPSGPVDG